MIYQYDTTPIFYEVRGQGPALLLLHGFLESSSMWDRLVSDYAPSRKCIKIDLPGHGKSGVLGPVHSMELMAKVVHAILKELGIASVTVIGHSMGGYVALAFVELFEEHVDGLVLLNSTPAEDSSSQKANRDRALRVFKKSPRIFISMAITNLFAEDSQEVYAAEITALKEEAFTFPPEGIMASIQGMKIRKDRTHILKHFRKKKYMICGTKDPIVPLEISETLARQCETPLEKVVGGHMILTENYAETVKKMHFID